MRTYAVPWLRDSYRTGIFRQRPGGVVGVVVSKPLDSYTRLLSLDRQDFFGFRFQGEALASQIRISAFELLET